MKRSSMLRWAATMSGLAVLTGLMAAAPADAAGTRADLSIQRTSHGQLITGHRATFEVQVPTRLRRHRVRLQRSVHHGRWVTVAHRRPDDSGHLELSGRAAGVGLNRWRAVLVVPRTQRHPRQVHVSRASRTTVFEWYRLTMDNAVNTDYLDDQVTIAGTNYAHSLYAYYTEEGEDVIGEWNLGYHCTTFSAVAGLDDGSETGMTDAFSTVVDGASTGLGTLGVGASKKVTRDVSGGFRIQLHAVTGPDPDPNDVYYTNNPSWGSPRVLCSARP